MKFNKWVWPYSHLPQVLCICISVWAGSASASEFSLNFDQTTHFFDLLNRFQKSHNQQPLKTVLDGYYGKSEALDLSSHASVDGIFTGRLEGELDFGMRGEAWNPALPLFEYRQLFAGQITYVPRFFYEFYPGLQLKLESKLLVGAEKSATKTGENLVQDVHVASGSVESFAGQGDLSWLWGSLFTSKTKLRPRYSVFQTGVRKGQHVDFFYSADFNWAFDDTAVGSIRLFTGYSNLEVSGLITIPLIDEIYLNPKAAQDWKRNIYLGVEKGLGRRSWFNTFAGIWGQRPFAGVRAQPGKHIKLLAYYSERSYSDVRNQSVGRQFSLGLSYIW